jgi:short-subunit dehydrogenase
VIEVTREIARNEAAVADNALIEFPAVTMSFTSFLIAIGCVCIFRSLFLFYRWIIGYVAPPVDLRSEFKTEWALVTGVASGLGRHLGRLIAEQGVNVIGVDRDTEGLEAARSDIEGLGREFVPVVVDLYRRNFVDSLMDACGDRDIGIVMINAGLGIIGPVGEMTDEYIDNYIFFMTTSYAILARAFAERNRKRAQKSVIYMTASLAGEVHGPRGVLYCAVKAYKSRLLKHLAIETGLDTKIRWTAMSPGFFRMSRFFRTVRPSVQQWADRFRLWPTSLEVAGAIMRCLGRTDLVDLTWQSLCFRVAQWGLIEPLSALWCKGMIVVGDWMAGTKK